MDIFKTEELSDEEREELEALKIQFRTPQNPDEEEPQVDENGNSIAPEEAEEDGTGQGEDGDSEKDEETDPENKVDTEVWKSFPIDPVTGYAQDPNTGYLIDPNTGSVVRGGSLLGEEEEGEEDTPEETKEDIE